MNYNSVGNVDPTPQDQLTMSDDFSTDDSPSPDDSWTIQKKQFKHDLQKCLDGCERAGTFWSLRTHETYTNPGLNIKKYGPVGLPLASRDAEAIARFCKQSPFGKGDETLVDTSVRRTWELDASEFECQNPLWGTFLQTLASQTLEDLGVTVTAEGEAYKLLLYEEGAFFKAHKDTEKVPGMFGTLVVCLPSYHTGGEVRLLHNGKERILATATSSSHGLSSLAWYSDVSHEVKPVQSGYRLVLTYNLVQGLTAPMHTAAALDQTHVQLERLLKRWNTEFLDVGRLLYPLEHQYTQSSMSLSSLKGTDAAKGQCIDRVSSRCGISWCLGQLTYTRMESIEDEGYDINSTTTPKGVALPNLIHDIVPGDLLTSADDFYGKRDPDSEDEGEFTGNESMPEIQRYHDTVSYHENPIWMQEAANLFAKVLILMRKEQAVLDFVSKVGYNSKPWAQQTMHSPKDMLAFFEFIRDSHYEQPDEDATNRTAWAYTELLRAILKVHYIQPRVMSLSTAPSSVLTCIASSRIQHSENYDFNDA